MVSTAGPGFELTTSWTWIFTLTTRPRRLALEHNLFEFYYVFWIDLISTLKKLSRLCIYIFNFLLVYYLGGGCNLADSKRHSAGRDCRTRRRRIRKRPGRKSLLARKQSQLFDLRVEDELGQHLHHRRLQGRRRAASRLDSQPSSSGTQSGGNGKSHGISLG
jgi:hypothetical protein